MKRTKKAVLTGLTLAALVGGLITSTAPVEASSAGVSVSNVSHQAPTLPSADVTIYWWVEAGAALAGGAAGGAVAGALGGPGGAAAGAAAGGLGGLVGYAVSSLFGVARQDAVLPPSTVRALD